MTILVLAGFVALAAGTHRSSRLLFRRLPERRVRAMLLALGYGLLAVSLGLVLAGDDAARRLVEWFGLLTVCALAVVLALWLWAGRG